MFTQAKTLTQAFEQFEHTKKTALEIHMKFLFTLFIKKKQKTTFQM